MRTSDYYYGYRILEAIHDPFPSAVTVVCLHTAYVGLDQQAYRATLLKIAGTARRL
jgi:hypothetical protein